MKFITEEDLRDLYKKQPFTDYDLKEGERLTVDEMLKAVSGRQGRRYV